MSRFLKQYLKIFSRIFSVVAVLAFVVANLLNPNLISFNTARASVDGIGASFSTSNGANWTATIYNDPGSSYASGQTINAQFGAYHCKSAALSYCSPNDTPNEFMEYLVSPRSETITLPEKGSSNTKGFDIRTVDCGTVQVDLGFNGGILGGEKYNFGRDCGGAAPVCQPGTRVDNCSVCKADGSGTGPDWGTYDGVGGKWCGCAQAVGNYNSSTYPQCFASAPPPTPATLTASCKGDPNPAKTGENVGWVASTSNGKPPFTYAWSGAVSGSSFVANGSYATPGTTTAYVDVTDSDNQKARGVCQVVVNQPSQGVPAPAPAQPGPASCSISPNPASPSIGVNQTFFGSFNPGSNSSRSAIDYLWNFGDGITQDSGQSSQGSHTYNNSGTYAVNLTVRANDGSSVNCSSSASVSGSLNQCRSISCIAPPAGFHYVGQITSSCDPNVAPTCGTLVADNPGSPNPISCFITPQVSSGFAPFSTTFNGNLLSAGSGNVSFSWDLNDDGVFGDAAGRAASSTFNRTSVVRLNVTDSANQSNSCFALVNILSSVAAGQPFCSLNVSQNPINSGNSVTLTATYNNNGGSGSAQSYNFSFGDGTSSAGSSNSATHTYNTGAVYSPSVRVSDNLGNQINCSTSLTVNSPAGATLASSECPAGTVKKTIKQGEVICELGGGQTVAPRVVQIAGTAATELPKSGLPLFAWAAAAFLPLGSKLRKFNKEAQAQASPHFLWEERQYRK